MGGPRYSFVANVCVLLLLFLLLLPCHLVPYLIVRGLHLPFDFLYRPGSCHWAPNNKVCILVGHLTSQLDLNGQLNLIGQLDLNGWLNLTGQLSLTSQLDFPGQLNLTGQFDFTD